MAAGWVKSLQCKSRAFDDVHHPTPNPAYTGLLHGSSCRNSYQNLKDVVGINTTHAHLNPKPKPKPAKPHQDSDSDNPYPKKTLHRRSDSTRPIKPDPTPNGSRVRRSLSAPIKPQTRPDFFPSLSDLPAGHPSRNVVEIIFRTRWGPKPFSGRVEMVFKIQTLPRTLARFEEYRERVIKARSGSGRCSADGNEMMRFSCLGPTSAAGIVVAGVGECAISAGAGKVAPSVCTYSGSGVAHESAGGGRGRRAVMVCRVIAGRVGLDSGELGEFDSVSGDNGELVVFDSRAVLPCFLVIYRL